MDTIPLTSDPMLAGGQSPSVLNSFDEIDLSPFYAELEENNFNRSFNFEYINEETLAIGNENPDAETNNYGTPLHENKNLAVTPPNNGLPRALEVSPEDLTLEEDWGLQILVNEKLARAPSNCCYWRSANRLYVLPNYMFTLHYEFKCNETAVSGGDMFIRVTACLDDDTHAPVVLNDGVSSVVATVPPGMEVGSTGAHGWPSVLVPVTKAQGSITLKMLAKNSDVGFRGNNSSHTSHPIALYFTLETANGGVYGRDNIKMRACSKPKRDLKEDKKKIEASHAGEDPQGPPRVTRPSGGHSNSKRCSIKRERFESNTNEDSEREMSDAIEDPPNASKRPRRRPQIKREPPSNEEQNAESDGCVTIKLKAPNRQAAVEMIQVANLSLEQGYRRNGNEDFLDCVLQNRTTLQNL